MRLIHTVFTAASAILITTASANALAVQIGPSATDPNFNGTDTAETAYYGMAAWGGTINSGNPSFIGSTPFLAGNQWNNGDPGNGVAKVGFISGNGSYAEQTINGFTAGNSYTISVLANSRIGVTQSALTITYSAVNLILKNTVSQLSPPVITTIYAAAIPVSNTNPTPTQTGAFTSVTSAAFVATSFSEAIRLANSGGADSSVLLSRFQITDLGVLAVPEPVSMTLLATGLLGLGLARRRR